LYFSLRIGFRYFRSGGSQILLSVASVAFGVTVYLFITSLIYGLQKGFIATTIGSSSHITILPAESEARVLPLEGRLNVATTQSFNERELTLKGYVATVQQIDRIPGLIAVSPVSMGSGLVVRGGQSRPISILGIDESRGSQIFDLRRAMQSGTSDLGGRGCCVGTELARLLGLRVGDKLRVLSAKKVDMVMRITGIFKAGNISANERSFYVSLANGQRLNDMVGTVSRIETQVTDAFALDQIAGDVRSSTGLKVQTWQEVNADLLNGLAAQSQTTNIIRLFVMILVATSVASVLIVSVMQRSREIGILKSMGASTAKLQGIFTYLGALVGVSGALVGAGLGGALILGIGEIPGESSIKPGYLFPIEMQLRFIVEAFLVTAGIATMAALLPARRAAKMNPVDVIRQG
jgi:lipoprotein-releasing system permease protein